MMNQGLEKFAEGLTQSLRDNWIAFSRQIPSIILAILIIAAGVFLAGKIGQWSRMAIGRRSQDEITTMFLSKAIKILISGLFIMYALKVSGLDGIASGILTAAGASAVIIGFAFRDIGENFISGIILSFNRPFNVGDTVLIGDIFGRVKTIEFRYAKLRTFDGKDVYIPNSDVIKKPVTNFTEDGIIRFDFLVGIAYENEINRARKIILEVLNRLDSVFKDPEHVSFVCADELATNTVNLRVHFWIKTYEYGREALTKRGDVISEVKSALTEAKINLPANIIEMKMYKDQPFIPMQLSESDPEKSSSSH